MQYIKIEYYTDRVVVSAWIKDVVMGEMELKGFFAALPKKSLKNTVNQICSVIF